MQRRRAVDKAFRRLTFALAGRYTAAWPAGVFAQPFRWRLRARRPNRNFRRPKYLLGSSPEALDRC